ncbi:MAG TPA: large conductance mechanosensitive channel protein MscL [Kofleriaceae bacterium]|nr:large conductance mechanosensitive channel protein MscL [Kofleriaceae bacterium]
MLKEFRDFIMRGNVVDLAVAVVIGAAFTKIVNAIVSEIIMPLIGKVMPEGGWTTYSVGGIRVGVVFNEIIQFLVVALVLFIVVVKFMGALKKKEAAAPSTKKCGECLEEIPIAARRCKACTSPQAG